MDTPKMRVGLGYDNHRLVPGRPFFLGGVEIPADVGAEAHSDGDVVIHALVDALLGATGQGDIGTHFPDSDPRWKGQASHLFLEKTAELVCDRGYQLVNLDVVILLERVRLKDHKQKIASSLRSIVAPWFELPEDAVSVKAKTHEQCDAVGEGRAVAAQVVVLLAGE
jgi:2-C-methyl-D-erythritol 2,4-cyclodiphosphate synthase